jgi:threonine dehydratase
VVAYSSGNHGQAVAAAARMFGTTAVIIMPEDTPPTKIDKTLSHGAEIVYYDRYRGDRAAIGHEIAGSRGLVLIPPFEDPHVIAGAGTLGREIVMQAKQLDAELDALLVCCSGGGLTAGCAIALEALSPETEVFAVEPVGFDDTARSLASGTRVVNDPAARSICDAVQSPTPGELTFSINSRLLSGALAVSDEEVIDAMIVAAREFGLVVEPGGAVALAAVLSRRLDPRGRTVAVTLSGSNVSLRNGWSAEHSGPVHLEVAGAAGD